MKNILIVLSSVSIICAGLFSSCAKKNTQASAPVKTTTKVETTTTTKNTTTNPTVKEKSSSEKVASTGSVNISYLQSEFAKQHTKASNVEWSKDSILSKQNKNADYIVKYIEDEKQHFITYASDGKIIEEKHEVLIDQLPQPSYNSIKEGYPDYKIVQVYTYKHITKEGSYLVITEKITDLNKEQQELFLRENGTFVK